MRIVRFDEGRIGLLEGEEVYDVTSAFPGHGEPWPETWFVRALERWEEVGSRVAAARRSAPPRALASCRLLAPVLNPSKVVAAPVNYAAHQAEMNSAHTVEGLGFFLKSPTSVVGPSDAIVLPYADRRTDPEVELAAVIGRRAHMVDARDALSHVFGYTICIDVTVRGGEDRSTRKSFDTFSPIGPCLVTPEEIGDPQRLRLRLWVNGELRQDAETSSMIHGVAELLARASRVFPLLPGDILTTGTPEGVGPVHPGDVVEVEIEKIGRFAMPVAGA